MIARGFSVLIQDPLTPADKVIRCIYFSPKGDGDDFRKHVFQRVVPDFFFTDFIPFQKRASCELFTVSADTRFGLIL